MPSAEELEAQGWRPVATRAFSAAIGPIWQKGEPGARAVALPVTALVANDHMEVMHGGAQMTFADIALGIATVDAIGGSNCATAQLHYSFTRAVRIGSLLVCRPEVVRRASRLVFTRGLFTVEDEVVGSADAIFNVFEAHSFKAG